MERVNEQLDLRAFIRYMAVQNFIGENDGFVGYAGMNNFYFYRKENSPTHVFLAWDEDNAFWGAEFPLDTRHGENVLMRKAMGVPELRDLYYETLLEAAIMAETRDEGADTGWLEQEVRRQLDQIEGPLSEDPNKPYTMDDYAASRTFMLITAQQRPRYVQNQVLQEPPPQQPQRKHKLP